MEFDEDYNRMLDEVEQRAEETRIELAEGDEELLEKREAADNRTMEMLREI